MSLALAQRNWVVIHRDLPIGADGDRDDRLGVRKPLFAKSFSPGVELETWMYTSSVRRAYRALFARNPRYGSTIMLGSDAVAPNAMLYG